MDPNQINFDEMMNNPDILLKACNDVFGNDTVVTQQQYYQQPAQTTSTYQQQTSQLQQQLQRSQIVEVLLKEVNELKTRIKKLEEESQRQAQMPSIQFPAIRMPIRLDIIDSGSPDTSSPAVGLGIAQKEYKLVQTNEKRPQNNKDFTSLKNSPFQDYLTFQKEKLLCLSVKSLQNKLRQNKLSYLEVPFLTQGNLPTPQKQTLSYLLVPAASH